MAGGLAEELAGELAGELAVVLAEVLEVVPIDIYCSSKKAHRTRQNLARNTSTWDLPTLRAYPRRLHHSHTPPPRSRLRTTSLHKTLHIGSLCISCRTWCPRTTRHNDLLRKYGHIEFQRNLRRTCDHSSCGRTVRPFCPYRNLMRSNGQDRSARIGLHYKLLCTRSLRTEPQYVAWLQPSKL